MAGESVAAMPVNSSAKLLTSNSSTILGTKGALTNFLATSSQFKVYDSSVTQSTLEIGRRKKKVKLCTTYLEERMLFKFFAIRHATTESLCGILDE